MTGQRGSQGAIVLVPHQNRSILSRSRQVVPRRIERQAMHDQTLVRRNRCDPRAAFGVPQGYLALTVGDRKD